MMDESLNSAKSQEQNNQENVGVAADFANNLKQSTLDLLGLIPIAAIAIALIVTIVAIVYGVIEIWIFAISHLGTEWGIAISVPITFVIVVLTMAVFRTIWGVLARHGLVEEEKKK